MALSNTDLTASIIAFDVTVAPVTVATDNDCSETIEVGTFSKSKIYCTK